MPACDVLGCGKSSHFYDYYKDESKKYSFHRVPDAYRSQACELLCIPPEKHNKSSIFICDSHMRPGSFFIKNHKKRLRTDFTFIELLVPPNLTATTTTASPAPSSAKPAATTPTIAAASKSPVASPPAQKDSSLHMTSYSEESSELSDDDDEEMCEDEPPPPSHTKEPRSAHKQQLQPGPSPSQVTSVMGSKPRAVPRPSSELDLMLRLKVSLTKAENALMDNERRTRELEEKMSATSARNQAELEARDKEIASLKKQVQQIIAENQSLVTANQSLSLDLTVYRKLVQFESNSATKGGCLNGTDSPGKRFRGGAVRRSIEEDLDEEEEEEPAKRSALEVAGHVMPASLKSKREPAPGTLDEIRKWLKNAKQF